MKTVEVHSKDVAAGRGKFWLLIIMKTLLPLQENVVRIVRCLLPVMILIFGR